MTRVPELNALNLHAHRLLRDNNVFLPLSEVVG